MDDEVVGGFLQEASLGDIALLAAAVALVVGNDLALNVLFQRVIDVLETFYFQGEWVEVLEAFFDGPAP